ncbi:MAG: carboxypeptidase-like regulatory domain-containing protein [Acidobacteriia bacterium]|nr:carboxypeptidase-like regulatory domain-containing protein [Terriglobia bacterium]
MNLSFRPAMLFLFACVAGWAQQGALPAGSVVEEKKLSGFSGMAMNSLTGAPLPHVEVRLLRTTAGDVSNPFASWGHTATGLDGKFALTGIEPGSYLLTADRNGYRRVDVLQDRYAPMLTVKPGEEIRDILLKLEPDGRIAGHVTGIDGEPIPLVEVEAVPALAKDTTDDRGQFVIGRLAPGRYLLKTSGHGSVAEVRKDGTVAVHYGPTYFPGVKSAGDAIPVTVRAGEESGELEIKLQPDRARKVSGEVSNDAPNLKVRVALSQSLGEEIAGLTTDGRFTLSGVPAGRYLLLAESFDSGQRSIPALLDVANNSVEGLHLTLLPMATVNVRTQKENWKRVAARMSPDEAVTLKLVPFGPATQVFFQNLNGDGGAVIRNVEPGRYHLLASGLPGDFHVKSAHLGDTQMEDGIIEIGAGPPEREMLIELAEDGARISGTVRDANGRASADQSALLFFDDAFGTEVASAAVTDADGAYVFHGVEPGNYKLLAVSKERARGWWSPEALALERDRIVKIEVRENDRVVKDLRIR